MADGSAIDEVNKGTSVIGVDMAGALNAAAWAGSQLRTETFHEGVKKGFR